MVWSDPSIQERLKYFVLAADEVWNLQHRDSPEARLFREFAEFGHYGRRSMDLTRQGIYAVTPAGGFLGSWNTRHLPTIQKELDDALQRWQRLEPEERLGSKALPVDWRWSDAYPTKGLALMVTTRDMPREDSEGDSDWRTHAWNQDRFWISEQELAAMRSDKTVLQALAHRFVRGQSPGYPKDAVQTARWTLGAVEGEPGRDIYRIHGFGSVEQTGRWAIDDRRDRPDTHQRSFAGPMEGRIEWEGDRCVRFELAWVGERRGATQFNGRADDLGPAPMGVVLTMAPPNDRVAPSMMWGYGWKRPSVQNAVPD